MKIPASLHIVLGMQYTNAVILLSFMAATSLISSIKDAYGYFHYVLIGFAILFICLEAFVIVCFKEMMRLQDVMGLQERERLQE